MLFNSYVFVGFFLPLTLAGFAAVSRLGSRAAMGWLTGASLLFYTWWTPAGLPLLLCSVLGNYVLSVLILRAGGRLRTAITVFGVTANLAVLAWCKYLAAVLGFLGLSAGATAILPLGISFFTFTQIGYLLDCRAGVTAGSSLLDYMLFVTFFPSIAAGPILSGNAVLPQFADRAGFRLSAMNLCVGSGFFLIGLLKKTLLADPLSAIVAPGFAHPGTLPMAGAWQAALGYSLQLYFDFSGYSDMAIGLGRMFGVRLPVNFASPYKAESVIDYWQRWHMTLTRFLMATVYTPVALTVMRWRRAHRRPVDRAAQRTPAGFGAMLAMPILVTMALVGIWHGANMTFLVFGLLHAVFLLINHGWRLFRGTIRAKGVSAVIGRVAVTYLSVVIGAAVFRADSVTGAWTMLLSMAGAAGAPLLSPDPKWGVHAAWLASLYAIVWIAPNTQQIMGQAESVRLRWRPTLPWAVAFGCAAAVGVLSIGGTGEFLYFQF